MSSNKIEESRKKTGGRKAGVPNKKSAAIIRKIEESGLTPLDYMLQVMRDESTEPESLRLDAAKSAAPYCHARLTAVELTGKDGKDLVPQPDASDVARRVAFILTQAALKKGKP